MQKKYISLSKLEIFLKGLKGIFAPIKHTHKTEDITDYKVDSVISSTSTNPISSKAVYDSQKSAMDSTLENAKKYADDCIKIRIKTWGEND